MQMANKKQVSQRGPGEWGEGMGVCVCLCVCLCVSVCLAAEGRRENSAGLPKATEMMRKTGITTGENK